MELRHLRYFAAVARAGTVTGAAGHLNISQPALTYQLKQIELELGVKLLERNSRGVSLTKAGTVLLAKADAILDEFESIGAALEPFQPSAARRIIVGMAPTPARAIAAELLEACNGRFVLQIREAFSDDLQKMVALGEVDCALLYNAEEPGRQVLSIPLVRETLFAIATPEVFAAMNPRVIRFQDLAKLPLVLESPQMAGRQLVDQAAARSGLRLNVVTASSIPVKKELIAKKKCCTVGPLGLYAEELAAGSLAARRIVEPGLDRTLSCNLLRSHEKLLTSFIALVERVVLKHVKAGVLQWTRAQEEANPV